MKVFLIILLSLGLNLFRPEVFASSLPVLVAQNPTEVVNSLSVLKDTSGKLTLEESKQLLTTEFKPFASPTGKTVSFGYTPETYWFHLAFDFSNANPADYLLELASPQFSFIDLYRVSKETCLTQYTGLVRPFSNREFANPNFVFTFATQQSGVVQYFFKLKTYDVWMVPFKHWHKKDFQDHTRLIFFLFGIYFGFYLVMSFYHLFLFIALRDKAFLFYWLFVTWFGLWMFSLSGYFNYYFHHWLDPIPFLKTHMNIGLALTTFFAGELSSAFIESHRVAPWIRRFKRILEYSAIACLALVLVIPYQYSIVFQHFFLISMMIVVVLESLWRTLKKDFNALYLLLAWSSLILSGFIYIGMLYGLFPMNEWTKYSVYIGSTGEMILFSLALANRYHRFEKDKIQNQNELNQLQAAHLIMVQNQLLLDDLTGLPNRQSLLRDQADRGESHLILMNIDRFREFNHFFGNTAGDNILLTLARSFNEFCRQNDITLYRLRGDEFAILVPGKFSQAELRALAGNIHEFCEAQHFAVEGQTVEILVSLGLAYGKVNQLKNANTAIREAKEKQKKYVLFEEAAKKEESVFHIDWIKKINLAHREKRILAYYQPIQNLKTGNFEKYEALIRMQDESGVLLSPATFLPIAKTTRLSGLLTRQMLNHGFSQIEKSPVAISINLGADDIFDLETTHYLFELLRKSSNPSQVVFEILESESIQSYDTVRNFIDEVKVFGAKIAIDDFGTGYSNFEHLIRLKVDFIKIDGSLIKELDTRETSRILVENIVKFSNKLGIETIAEFVHNQAVYDRVKLMGVHYAQGYHLGQPKPHLLS